MRANVFFDKVREPPHPGSLQEAVCVLVQRYRLDQQFFQTVLLSSEDPKVKEEAFGKYRHALMPFLERVDNKEKARVKAELDKYANAIFRLRDPKEPA